MARTPARATRRHSACKRPSGGGRSFLVLLGGGEAPRGCERVLYRREADRRAGLHLHDQMVAAWRRSNTENFRQCAFASSTRAERSLRALALALEVDLRVRGWRLAGLARQLRSSFVCRLVAPRSAAASVQRRVATTLVVVVGVPLECARRLGSAVVTAHVYAGEIAMFGEVSAPS